MEYVIMHFSLAFIYSRKGYKEPVTLLSIADTHNKKVVLQMQSCTVQTDNHMEVACILAGTVT